MTTASWLKRLNPGDRIAIYSMRGNRYEVTYVGCGDASHPSHLYVRKANRSLARLSLNRLDADTFELLGHDGRVIYPGDEVMLTPKGGEALRAQLVETDGGRLTLETHGALLSVHCRDVSPSSLRLVFRSGDLLPGDEFLVRSRSGSEYRGLARIVSPRTLKIRTSDSQALTLHVDRLDLYSLVVLIPLDLSASLCARV